MSLSLKTISEKTIQDYRARADLFWQGTKDHDVSQNYHKFLTALGQNSTYDILDFGCGPGRDLLYFKHAGHRPIGLDGSPEFCAMARHHSGCQVLEQDFLNLSLTPQSFDGIFANASLFHVPSSELPRVLEELKNALRSRGVLFSSNPRGKGEGWQGNRFGHFMEIETYQAFLDDAGFEVLEYYYRPEGLPFEQQPWLAVVARAH